MELALFLECILLNTGQNRKNGGKSPIWINLWLLDGLIVALCSITCVNSIGEHLNCRLSKGFCYSSELFGCMYVSCCIIFFLHYPW